MPPLAFMPISEPTVLRISLISSSVAPKNEKPVDVLIKSAPAFTASSETIFFSSSVKRQVSIITFTQFPSAASTTFSISDCINLVSPSLRAEILMTISNSSAP